jgi:hypothetical protein
VLGEEHEGGGGEEGRRGGEDCAALKPTYNLGYFQWKL